MLYGEGLSREGGLIDLAVERDILQKSGSWFSYEGERIAQGRDNVRVYLKEHPDVFDAIEKRIREDFNAGNISVELEQDEGEDEDGEGVESMDEE